MDRIEVLVRVAGAMAEAVDEAGERGMPGGHLYGVMMAAGMSLGVFEQIMGALVEAGRVRKVGEVYYRAR